MGGGNLHNGIQNTGLRFLMRAYVTMVQPHEGPLRQLGGHSLWDQESRWIAHDASKIEKNEQFGES